MAFRTEEDLFRAALSSPYIQKMLNSDLNLAYFVEPKGLFGIPDLVIVNADPSQAACRKRLRVFAFEMKLSNWKRALIQAFKYRAFAHCSIVLIDADHVGPALLHLDQFKKSRIGLLSITKDGHLKIHNRPSFGAPYSTGLENSISERVLSLSNDSACNRS